MKLRVITSESMFDDFNVKRIEKKLIEETGIDKETAKKISIEVEDKIRELNLKDIPTPLIRELVDCVLLQEGLLEERRLNTRVGLPIYEITKLIKQGSKDNANLRHNPETIHKYVADACMKEYSLIMTFPEDIVSAHLSGKIHLHDLEYAPIRTVCCQHDMREFFKNGLKVDGTGKHTVVSSPAKHPNVAIQHMAKVMASAQCEMSGGQSIDEFNVWIAPYIRGLTYDEVRQLMQMFIYELGQMYVARGGQSLVKSELVFIRENEILKCLPIGEFIDNLMEMNKNEIILNGDTEFLNLEEGFETISVNKETGETEFKKIYAISRHLPNSKIVKLTLQDGRDVSVTEHHSLFNINKEGNIVEVKPSEDLKSVLISNTSPFEIKYKLGDKIKIDVDRSNSRIEINKDLLIDEDFCKFIGLFVGDGYCETKRYAVGICKPEEEIKNFVRKVVSKLFEDEITFNDRELEIRVFNKNLKEFMKNLVGLKAQNKKVPEFVLYGDEEIKKNFLLGMISSDGCVEQNGRTTITTTSKRLVGELNLICNELGFITQIRKTHREGQELEIKGRKTRRNHDLYNIDLYKNDLSFLKGLILSRKCNATENNIIRKLNYENLGEVEYSKINELEGKFKNVLPFGIKEIKNVKYKDHVYDLSVVDNENFITNQGVICHNTVFSSINCELEVPEYLKNQDAIKGGKVVGVYGDYEDEVKMVAEALCDIMIGGDKTGKPFLFPNLIFKLRDSAFKNENQELLFKIHELSAKWGLPYFINMKADYQNGNTNAMGCVDYDEVIIYKFNGKLCCSSIGKLKQNLLDNSYEIKKEGISDYINLNGKEEYEIFDGKNFVKLKKYIINPNRDNWVKLKLENGRQIIVTDDHPFYTKRGKILTKDLNLNDEIPVLYENKFNSQKNVDEDYAWLLGLILCDGNRNLTISIGLDEEDILEKIKKVVDKHFKNKLYVETKYHDRNKKGKYIDVKLKNLKGTCKKEIIDEIFGMYKGIKKIERQIPNEVFTWNETSRLAFLCGMIDADGYVNVKDSKSRIQIGSTNKELAIQQMLLAQTLNCPSKIYDNHYNSNDYSKIRYRIEFGCDERFKQYLSSQKKINKINIKANLQYNDYSKVVSIEYIDYGKESYDVETESGKFYVSGIISSNCRTRLSSEKGATDEEVAEQTLRTGNMQWYTINLPRIAYKSKREDRLLFDNLERELETCKKALLLKHKISLERLNEDKTMEFLMQKFNGEDYYRYKNTTKTFGFVGLNEMMKFHTGYELHENKEAQKLGVKVISFIRKYADKLKEETGLRWTVTQTPAETTAGRFARLDYKYCKNIEILNYVNGDKNDLNSIYYTNSSHVRVDSGITMGDKIKIEEEYHPLCNGGHIAHFWNMDNYSDPEIMIDITKKMCKSDIGFWTYTKNLNICGDCKHSATGIKEKCGNCGSKNVENFSRITGYLQNVSNWNEAKKRELLDRKVFK